MRKYNFDRKTLGHIRDAFLLDRCSFPSSRLYDLADIHRFCTSGLEPLVDRDPRSHFGCAPGQEAYWLFSY